MSSQDRHALSPQPQRGQNQSSLVAPEPMRSPPPGSAPRQPQRNASASFVPPGEPGAFSEGPSEDRTTNHINAAPTGNLAPSQRLRHYASLLVAEKPMDSHRAFQRRMRTGNLDEDPATVAAADPDVPAPNGGDEDAALETINTGAARPAFPGADGHFPLEPEYAEAVMPARQPTRNGSSNSRKGSGTVVTSVSVTAGGLPSDAAAVVGEASDPEYEELRKRYKQGFKYRLIRKEILKNKRRRGRAGYLATLKTLYNSIVPSGGRLEPQKLAGTASLRAHAYLYAMVIFDSITPTLLGLNASLVLVFLSACMAMTTFFSAGQRLVWLEGINAAEGGGLPQPEGEKTWGPQRLWHHYISENKRIGGGVYLTEWGAVGAAVIKASGEPWRYVVAVLVHESVWHLLLVGGCAVVSGVLVERRYGLLRMTIMALMLSISSSMGTVLFADKCSITYGSSPLAWGLLGWWGVDTAARVTLWPLGDLARLSKVAVTYKNLSNFILFASTLITLLISELALGASSAIPAIVAVVSVLTIAPVIAPRWSTSPVEVATVPIAAVGALIFWVIIPIAGAGRAAGITESELASCYLVRLIPT